MLDNRAHSGLEMNLPIGRSISSLLKTLNAGLLKELRGEVADINDLKAYASVREPSRRSA